MSLKLFLLASLLLAGPSACTRIVKHYHYHFGSISLPTSSWNLSLKTVANQYLADHPSLSWGERRFFVLVSSYAENNTVNKLLDPYFVYSMTSYSYQWCTETVPMVGRVVVLSSEARAKLLKVCQESEEEHEDYDGWRRRLGTSRGPRSNH